MGRFGSSAQVHTLYLACAAKMSKHPIVSLNLVLCVNLPRQVPSEMSLSLETCKSSAQS